VQQILRNKFNRLHAGLRKRRALSVQEVFQNQPGQVPPTFYVPSPNGSINNCHQSTYDEYDETDESGPMSLPYINPPPMTLPNDLSTNRMRERSISPNKKDFDSRCPSRNRSHNGRVQCYSMITDDVSFLRSQSHSLKQTNNNSNAMNNNNGSAIVMENNKNDFKNLNNNNNNKSINEITKNNNNMDGKIMVQNKPSNINNGSNHNYDLHIKQLFKSKSSSLSPTTTNTTTTSSPTSPIKNGKAKTSSPSSTTPSSLDNNNRTIKKLQNNNSTNSNNEKKVRLRPRSHSPLKNLFNNRKSTGLDENKNQTVHLSKNDSIGFFSKINRMVQNNNSIGENTTSKSQPMLGATHPPIRPARRNSGASSRTITANTKDTSTTIKSRSPDITADITNRKSASPSTPSLSYRNGNQLTNGKVQRHSVIPNNASSIAQQKQHCTQKTEIALPERDRKSKQVHK
jgi:hypothetical protein